MHFARVRAVTAVGASEWATVSEGGYSSRTPGAPALLSLSSGASRRRTSASCGTSLWTLRAGPAGGAGLLS